VVVFCLGATAISMWFFVSLYVQQVLGFSALEAGLTFAPMSLTIVAFTQLASRLAARCGPARVLTIGMTLLGAGMLLFSQIEVDGSWTADVLLPSLLCAGGIGCSFVSTTIVATTGVARENSGLASGLVNTSFQIGGSIGLALLATVAAGHTAGGTAAALTEGFQRAFAAGGVFALAGAAVALAALSARRPSQPQDDLAVEPEGLRHRVDVPVRVLARPLRGGRRRAEEVPVAAGRRTHVREAAGGPDRGHHGSRRVQPLDPVGSELDADRPTGLRARRLDHAGPAEDDGKHERVARAPRVQGALVE
jgi:MFS family permease